MDDDVCDRNWDMYVCLLHCSLQRAHPLYEKRKTLKNKLNRFFEYKFCKRKNLLLSNKLLLK